MNPPPSPPPLFCQTSSLEKGQGIKWRQGAPISTLTHLSVGEVPAPEFLVKPEVCIYDWELAFLLCFTQEPRLLANQGASVL